MNLLSFLPAQATDSQNVRRIQFITRFSLVGCGVLFFFGIGYLLSGKIAAGLIEILVASGGILNLLQLQWTKNIRLASTIFLLLLTTVLIFLLFSGGIENTGIFWFFVFPFLAFFLQGSKDGLIWTVLIFLLLSLTWILQSVGIITTPFTPLVLRQLSISFCVTAILVYLYESINERSTHLLEEEKIRDEAILSSIGDGLVVTDAKGKIVFINQQGEEILFLRSSEALGISYEKLWQVEDEQGRQVDSKDRPIYQTFITRKKTKASCVYVRHGKKIPVAVTITPLFQDGQFMGVVDVFRDISKEKEVDRIKTEFITLASHQLRTPLTAIRWFLELLRDGDAGKLTRRQSEVVADIDTSTLRMIDIVSDLLNVSKVESGTLEMHPERTDLPNLIRKIVKEIKPRLEAKNLTLTLHFVPNVPQISIDPKLIEEVYRTFLSNAIKYTPEGGRAELRLELTESEIISSIKDTGHGIPSEEQHRIFTRFFRGSNIVPIETEGSGLGLYLVQAIVRASGGRVWLHSEEGKGSTFWFSLPLDTSLDNPIPSGT